MSGQAQFGWGLAGASTIADEWMISAIRDQPSSRIVAVASTSRERGEAFARAHAIDDAYTSLEAMLGDDRISIVYISTTNELHVQQARLAIDAGKHVLCEKPVALCLADARALGAAASGADVVVGVNHHYRNSIAHRAARDLVGDGALGEPLAARVFHSTYLPERQQTWRISSERQGGGVVFDLTVHDADVLRFILGDEVDAVCAMTVRQGMSSGPVEDGAMGVMRFAGGTLASFHDAFTLRHAGTGLEVHGDNASLVIDDAMADAPIARIFVKQNGETEPMSIGEPEDLYTAGVRGFVDAVATGGDPPVTIDDATRSLAVALAVREASETGRVVEIRADA